ncbi:glycerol-3-phosphate acyltransferase 3-like [Condylostylus longicornis]|uniref:glycerol-3-phosphate acyltransferase 3-like n=1 Tax=Condylostylus longicornis TaxID=2530218 RepID=UPI00244E4E25|nr:glycerol-3-phosphate acyltransferase 3-like [Condylostylus longicornis]XP_055376675.1 glycerol-3-phosphate acyltransferase 3-like [Condylostylus longicornis]XP_055376676.1 glycerol-3-phosphate acyltransferase 3-like [Condylostylus longicornis]XP_055376677.1 glycerol-3-phosphate acyltransferase 3-like [Condylostylus longicornis]
MGMMSAFSNFILFVIFLAAINKVMGVRRAYVALMVKIFEYGRQNIEKAKKKTRLDDESKQNMNSGINDLKSNSAEQNDVIENDMKDNDNALISRDTILLPDGDKKVGTKMTEIVDEKEIFDENEINLEKDSERDEINFSLENCLPYIKTGVEAIIEDEVTSRFDSEELKNWNLLTRTNRHYEFISWRLTIIWMIGFILRYAILMPIRVFICFFGVLWLTICTAVVGFGLPESDFKRKAVSITLNHCFSILSSALSPVINYHNIENRPQRGICVANHTSPIDVLILMCDNTYSLIGQRHGGFLGVLQRALARASPHIWFERAEAKDRHAVTERLKQHVSDPRNPPILIFPEGTCINNTSVMQFKKGSFEVGGVIYPVAVKYDARFGDAFWNSSKYSMMQYLYMMMTSWAIVCDVWYLPPMYQKENESAIDFANRVKGVIAKQGGLVDLVWDGQLKRTKPKKEWKEKQQIEFTKRLKGE